MQRWSRRATTTLTMLGLAFAAGCASQHAVAPELTDESLGGEWHEALGVVGASVVMTLEVHDKSITGNGSWSIEAGRNGTMTVSGDIAAGMVELDMARSDSGLAHFRGSLIRADSMAGIIWYRYPDRVGDPVGVSFLKGHAGLHRGVVH